jgi:hypothetical protein
MSLSTPCDDDEEVIGRVREEKVLSMRDVAPGLGNILSSVDDL